MRSADQADYAMGQTVKLAVDIKAHAPGRETTVVPAGSVGRVVGLWLIGTSPETMDTDPIMYRVCDGDPHRKGHWAWDAWVETGSLMAARDALTSRASKGPGA
jgi:hypothetical protein